MSNTFTDIEEIGKGKVCMNKGTCEVRGKKGEIERNINIGRKGYGKNELSKGCSVGHQKHRLVSKVG